MKLEIVNGSYVSYTAAMETRTSKTNILSRLAIPKILADQFAALRYEERSCGTIVEPPTQ
jgi:hypothetical protein